MHWNAIWNIGYMWKCCKNWKYYLYLTFETPVNFVFLVIFHNKICVLVYIAFEKIVEKITPYCFTDPNVYAIMLFYQCIEIIKTLDICSMKILCFMEIFSYIVRPKSYSNTWKYWRKMKKNEELTFSSTSMTCRPLIAPVNEFLWNHFHENLAIVFQLYFRVGYSSER